MSQVVGPDAIIDPRTMAIILVKDHLLKLGRLTGHV